MAQKKFAVVAVTNDPQTAGTETVVSEYTDKENAIGGMRIFGSAARMQVATDMFGVEPVNEYWFDALGMIVVRETK